MIFQTFGEWGFEKSNFGIPTFKISVSGIWYPCVGSANSYQKIKAYLLRRILNFHVLRNYFTSNKKLSIKNQMISEEFDELSRLIRTCSGDISVNKCEGGCNSNVQPSVVTPNGFLKVSSLG